MPTTLSVVGSSSNTEAQNRTALIAAIQGANNDTIIPLAAGAVFKSFFWPKNTNLFKVVAAVPANPPILRGVCLTGNSVDGLFRETMNSASKATSVTNTTFEGVTIRAPRITNVHNPANGNDNYAIPGPDGTGYGVRIDDTFPGFDGLGNGAGQHGAMIGVMADGDNGLHFLNCTFNGYNRILDLSSMSNLDIRHCLFEEWCIDCAYIGSGSNITIEYNIWERFRGLNYADMHNAFGYTQDAQIPPHSDMLQLFSKTTNFVRQYNECYDSSDRCHCFLGKIRDGGSGGGGNPPPRSNWHVGMINRNNYSRSTHVNGDWIDYAIAPIVERNKGWGYGGATPNLAVGRHGSIDPTVVDAVMRNNVASGLGPASLQKANELGGYADWSNNIQVNNGTTMPPGWVEFRRDVAPNNVKRAGPYGDPGGVTPPTGPATLTSSADFDFYQFVVDPDLPATDPWRTLEIIVPSTSDAIDSEELRWTSAENDGARVTVYVGAGPSGSKIYRLSSGARAHLRLPGAPSGGDTFDNIGVVHATTAGGALSAASTYTFDATLPYEGVPDPVLVDTVRLDEVRNFSSTEGFTGRLVSKEFGIVWRQSCL